MILTYAELRALSEAGSIDYDLHRPRKRQPRSVVHPLPWRGDMQALGRALRKLRAAMKDLESGRFCRTCPEAGTCKLVDQGRECWSMDLCEPGEATRTPSRTVPE